MVLVAPVPFSPTQAELPADLPHLADHLSELLSLLKKLSKFLSLPYRSTLDGPMGGIGKQWAGGRPHDVASWQAAKADDDLCNQRDSWQTLRPVGCKSHCEARQPKTGCPKLLEHHARITTK